jgi:hypothetical protein
VLHLPVVTIHVFVTFVRLLVVTRHWLIAANAPAYRFDALPVVTIRFPVAASGAYADMTPQTAPEIMLHRHSE